MAWSAVNVSSAVARSLLRFFDVEEAPGEIDDCLEKYDYEKMSWGEARKCISRKMEPIFALLYFLEKVRYWDNFRTQAEISRYLSEAGWRHKENIDAVVVASSYIYNELEKENSKTVARLIREMLQGKYPWIRVKGVDEEGYIVVENELTGGESYYVFYD